LRASSPTYLRWLAETRTAENTLALYVPEGVAHEFQMVEAESHVLSEFYDPVCAREVRWDTSGLPLSY